MLTSLSVSQLFNSPCGGWDGTGYGSIGWRPLQAQQRNFHVQREFKTVADEIGKCDIANHVFFLSSLGQGNRMRVNGLRSKSSELPLHFYDANVNVLRRGYESAPEWIDCNLE